MPMKQSTMPLQGETQTPSESSLANCLMRTSLLFSRVLTAEEGAAWKTFLSPYSSKGIEWAFGEWQKTGKFFPKPKEILDLLEEFKVAKRAPFVACQEDGCMDGWKQVFTGKTVGGHNVDPVMGAVTRCHCFQDYMAGVRV